MGGAPYDKRNAEDYAAITKRIKAALKKIKKDSSIPATEASLCKLAECSRGTLRNRKCPLEELKKIKEARKKKADRKRTRISREHLTEVEVHIKDKHTLKRQLNKSRTEIAVWVHKFKNVEDENKKLSRANKVLSSARQKLQEQVDEYERRFGKLKPALESGRDGRVIVPFPHAGQGEGPAGA